MKQLVRIVIFTAMAFAGLTLYAIAQQKPSATPAATPPQMSTAEKIAVQSLEKQKQDAATAWQTAQQQELSIMRDWSQAHPGFHLHFNPQNAQDPQNFTAEADVPSPEEKPAKTPTEKTAEKK